MPWSFVTFIEQILQKCRSAGFEKEIHVNRLRTEMMRVTGVTNQSKLGQYIHVMKELGYVKEKGEFIIELCVSFDRPYIFAGDDETKVVKPVSTPELDAKIADIKAATILKEK